MGYNQDAARGRRPDAGSRPLSKPLTTGYPNPDERYEAVNFGTRRGPGFEQHGIDILMMHYTGMDDGEAARRWLCCQKSGVSCHYLVHEDGRIVQMVDEGLRAHHAGAGFWQGDDDVNSRSIGIEIVNPGHEAGLPDFPSAQMDAVALLAKDIIARHAIAPTHVLAHSDTAPGRKVDPGEKFDWGWLHHKGIGHWVEPEPQTSGMYLQQGESGQPVEALQSMLALYGYGVDITADFDAKTRAVVEAFQRHFRPALVDGVADTSTIKTLHRLLKEIP